MSAVFSGFNNLRNSSMYDRSHTHVANFVRVVHSRQKKILRYNPESSIFLGPLTTRRFLGYHTKFNSAFFHFQILQTIFTHSITVSSFKVNVIIKDLLQIYSENANIIHNSCILVLL